MSTDLNPGSVSGEPNALPVSESATTPTSNRGHGVRRCRGHWHVTIDGEDIALPSDPFASCDEALDAANALNILAAENRNTGEAAALSRFFKYPRPCPTSRAPASSSGMPGGDVLGGTLREERLREIEARANAATPGPWRTVTNLPRGPWHDRDCIPLASDRMPVLSRNWKEACLNAHFIANARQDVPALLAALRSSQERERRAVQRAEDAERGRDDLRAFTEVKLAELSGLRSELSALREQAARDEQDAKRWRVVRPWLTITGTVTHAERVEVGARFTTLALPNLAFSRAEYAALDEDSDYGALGERVIDAARAALSEPTRSTTGTNNGE